MENHYIGFDLSTQKLKAVVFNNSLTEQLYSAEVKFDVDLPNFQTCGGVNSGKETNEFYVNPVMWVEALEHVLDRLVLEGANFLSVVGISGSAQQHGSVYWSKQGIEKLQKLDADCFLRTQINEDAFVITNTPIWMDSTTTEQCLEMEEAIGGRDEMVKITGSKSYERFTGSQIRKIYQKKPECYNACERISLVSSFLASLFLNKIAPIDYSDGSGMNLLDINEKRWSQKCLDACAPNLAEKLGEPTPSWAILGNIGQYFVQRYNFNPKCKVIAFTGDNPSALAGLNIGDNWITFSLGTSDTIMMNLKEHPKIQQGHVLLHPCQADSFMGLLCFRNGSFVRDIFKKSEGNDNWEYFTELLELSPRGNNGFMALHYHAEEIIPQIKGSLRWGPISSKENKANIQFTSQQTEIRALIEGQMINRKAVALEMGFNFGENTKILATGGSSANRAILQVLADVFDAPVYVQKSTEAAAIGGVYRTKYVLEQQLAQQTGESIDSYYEYIKKLCCNYRRVCDPSPNSGEIYIPMMKRYKEMVEVMMENRNELEMGLLDDF